MQAEPTLSWRGPRLAGLALLGLGIAVLAATTQVPSAREGWAVSGPRFAPLVVSLMLIVLALLMLLRTAVRPDVELARVAAANEQLGEWRAPRLVALALLGYLALLLPLGFALASALFFTVDARILGSRRPVRDAVWGVILGAVVSWTFTRWLGVRLPVGPWQV
jgi:putative tricarboxylic transport membrane protein